jgi:hypothetical protein
VFETRLGAFEYRWSQSLLSWCLMFRKKAESSGPMVRRSLASLFLNAYISADMYNVAKSWISQMIGALGRDYTSLHRVLLLSSRMYFRPW